MCVEICYCVVVWTFTKMLNCFKCACFARSIAVCACFSRIESHDLALSSNVQFITLDVFEKNKHSRCDVHLWQKHFRQNMFIALKTIKRTLLSSIITHPKILSHKFSMIHVSQSFQEIFKWFYRNIFFAEVLWFQRLILTLFVFESFFIFLIIILLC